MNCSRGQTRTQIQFPKKKNIIKYKSEKNSEATTTIQSNFTYEHGNVANFVSSSPEMRFIETLMSRMEKYHSETDSSEHGFPVNLVLSR